MSWAAEEFADLDLGDKRLNARMVKIAESFARQPTASIPGACGGWAETQAAYRALSNQRDFDWQDLLKPHWACTQARMAEHPLVLCIQDTTELDFNGQQIQGLGRLSYEAQRGMYLHPTYAVTPDREPLGTLDCWMWARAPVGSKAAKAAPVESLRWIEGYERIAERAAELPQTRLVYVADREGDILELMQRAAELNHPADYLLRSQHNRKLPKGHKLWDQVKGGEPLGAIRFTLKARPGQPAREVRQTVWARRLTLAEGIEATCVIAQELEPPAGAKPLEWRLLTNRDGTDFATAIELIDWYRARWEIELLFHIVKNACRIEALQLQTVERLERAIAVYLVVAWRIGHLMRLGRSCPDLPAELYFSEDEWKGAHVLLKKKVPESPPTLNQVIRLIATLGGFLGRKGDGEPGVKTLWLGLQRVADFAAGLQHARAAGVL